ncbi:MAG: LAGLIDADG family homing endonuclease [Candidatus Hodarchaeales archaeon]|jgi:hypothetical protein
MAYVLGFIFADGCILRYKASSSLKIKIKDKKLLEKMNGVMSSNYPIKSERNLTDIIYSLTITRNEIVQDLIKLGLTTRKSLIMQFPDIPEQFIFYFIRGYFDGDGNTGIMKKYLIIEFTCGSKEFLEELYKILENHPIKCSIREIRRESIYYSLKILAENRKEFYELLYKDATIFLERKFSILQYYFEAIHPTLHIIKCKDCSVKFRRNNNNQKRCLECQSKANKERYMRYYYKNKK